MHVFNFVSTPTIPSSLCFKVCINFLLKVDVMNVFQLLFSPMVAGWAGKSSFSSEF